MDLKQLMYFQRVAQLTSVTRAAEQFHVAQPAITIAIQKLEEELEISLFDRRQKRFALTAEGEYFLRRVDSILVLVEDTLKEMKDYRKSRNTSIKIGIPPMVGTFLFPHVFDSFQRACPHLDLIATEEGSLAIAEQLERGDLDVGIITLSQAADNLATTLIATAEIAVCLPPNHPLRNAKYVSLSDLRNESFILLKEDTLVRQLVLRECERHRITPRIVFTSGQITTILGLVERGMGISFLLDAIVQSHPTICHRPLTDHIIIQIGVAWNRSRYLSKASQEFIGFMKNFPVHQNVLPPHSG
ncbi:MAG TPA: LysR family transcriptional regulator [Patescibacteria group bacterium]|nr:LysR family transcriptional regulator [Patescibacteria group bacterium]